MTDQNDNWRTLQIKHRIDPTLLDEEDVDVLVDAFTNISRGQIRRAIEAYKAGN